MLPFGFIKFRVFKKSYVNRKGELKMKKVKWVAILFSVLVLVVLAACGNEEKASSSSEGKELESKEVVLKISASSTPHAEILE